MFTKLFAVLLLLACFIVFTQAEVSIFVSVSRGSDSNPGNTTTAPFQTLSKAASTIVSLKNSATTNNTYVVYIEEGRYFINSTITLSSPSKFNDGNSPVIWKPLQEGQVVKITGGIPLPSYLWTTVTSQNNPEAFNMIPSSSQGKVLQLNLTQIGLSPSQIVKMKRNGQYIGSTNSQNELFFKGRALTIARYPNRQPDDSDSYMLIGANPGPNNFTFNSTYAPNKNKWPQEKYPFAFGYWAFDWADGKFIVQIVNKII